MKIVVGTRASKLALVQTQIVITKLKEKFPEINFEVKEIITSGDKILDVSLDKIGGKGLFLKEIEDALLSKKIDIAVHSMKDVPAFLPDGLILSSVLPREDSEDALLSEKYNSLDEIPKGSVIGTSSARRRVQLMLKRPDLTFKILRGNVLTRLQKLKDGQYDAAIMALAGLKRLGLESEIKQTFSKSEMIPAIAQGAICIENREEDKKISELCKAINCEKTFITTSAERAFLKGINGDCSTPIGATAEILKDSNIKLNVWYADYEGKFEFHHEEVGKDPLEIGKKSASIILENLKRCTL